MIKSGPLAVTLEFSGEEKLADDKRVASLVRIGFPLGKSWLKVDWSVADASDSVAALSAEVRLRLDPAAASILADVGAGGWTYAALRPDEQLIYRVRGRQSPHDGRQPAWQVDRVLEGRATPYAAAPGSGAEQSPQGWAHLMDGKRCTAIAIDQFAEEGQDTIGLSAAGPVQLRRDFAVAAAGGSRKKRLAFWLHVVSAPPQVGAVTSPQSMQTPPEVRPGPWKIVKANAGRF